MAQISRERTAKSAREWDGGVISDRVVREGLTEVTFEQRPEGGGGVSHRQPGEKHHLQGAQQEHRGQREK